jgi:hypothetical protein
MMLMLTKEVRVVLPVEQQLFNCLGYTKPTLACINQGLGLIGYELARCSYCS